MIAQLVTKKTKQKPCVLCFRSCMNALGLVKPRLLVSSHFCSCLLWFFIIISIFHRMYFISFWKGKRSGQCHQTQG